MAERGTRVADYDYELATDRIARYPADRRDESRLMTLRADGSVEHRRFREIVELFRPGDLLVVNESRVLPLRLLGAKPTGAPAEVLLIRPAEEQDVSAETSSAWEEARLWEALVRPGSKLKPGRTVIVDEELSVEIEDGAPGGGRLVRLVTELPTKVALERYGHVPLPPYLDRNDEALDRERYQTVYASVPGSVAAPTAGFHFTEALLRAVEAVGVERVAVTLDVGVGTFRPVDGDSVETHEMHSESYTVPGAVVDAVERARAGGGAVWAVGTTVVRALESSIDHEGRLLDGRRSTRLFIRPPYEFRVVDGLITNFHLPRSTLLMLVAAFAGYDRVMAAYREAVAKGYRFFSYGDAMAVEPCTR